MSLHRFWNPASNELVFEGQGGPGMFQAKYMAAVNRGDNPILQEFSPVLDINGILICEGDIVKTSNGETHAIFKSFGSFGNQDRIWFQEPDGLAVKERSGDKPEIISHVHEDDEELLE